MGRQALHRHTHQINTVVDIEVYERYEKMAARRGLGMAEFTRLALEHFVNYLDRRGDKPPVDDNISLAREFNRAEAITLADKIFEEDPLKSKPPTDLEADNADARVRKLI